MQPSSSPKPCTRPAAGGRVQHRQRPRRRLVVAELSSHPDVAKVTFTGSTAVVFVRSCALRAETMKRITLELGGKGPNIILADADVEGRGLDRLVAVGFLPTAARPASPARAGLGRRDRACRSSSNASGRRSRPSRSGGPRDPSAVKVGPMVRPKVSGIGCKATFIWAWKEGWPNVLVAAGEGRPAGLLASGGWFVQLDGLRHRRAQRHAHRPRGDFWAGAVRHPLPDNEEEAIAIANTTAPLRPAGLCR